jgi:hypothetical protein
MINLKMAKKKFKTWKIYEPGRYLKTHEEITEIKLFKN